MPWLTPDPGFSSRNAAGERLAPSRQSVLFLLACVWNPRCTKPCQGPRAQVYLEANDGPPA